MFERIQGISCIPTNHRSASVIPFRTQACETPLLPKIRQLFPLKELMLPYPDICPQAVKKPWSRAKECANVKIIYLRHNQNETPHTYTQQHTTHLNFNPPNTETHAEE